MHGRTSLLSERVCECAEVSCFAFGHMMRECGVKGRLCQKCGESGHVMKECKKESVYRNCILRGGKWGHSVLSVECPKYVRALGRVKARIRDR